MEIFMSVIFILIGIACIIIGAEILRIRMNDMEIILAREKAKYRKLPIAIITIGDIIVILGIILLFSNI